MSYIVLYALYVVASIFRWIVVVSICGVGLIFAMLSLFLEPLFSKKRLNLFDIVAMIASFVSFIVLLALYISAIDNENLRVVLTALVAASLGGLLTLSGVAISIKYTRIYREEEILENLKPHFYVVSDARWNSLDKEKQISKTVPYIVDEGGADENLQHPTKYRLDHIRLGNPDLSICSLYGLSVDNLFIKFTYEIPLTKDSFTALIFAHLMIDSDEEINDISLICEDIRNNFYAIKLGFITKNSSYFEGKEIQIKSTFPAEKLSFRLSKIH